jgi:hypothetical protein
MTMGDPDEMEFGDISLSRKGNKTTIRRTKKKR